MLTLVALAAMSVSTGASPRALWVWGTEDIRNIPAKRAEFFGFVEAPRGVAEHRFEVLFFDGMSVEDLSDPKQVPNIRSFIVDAHRRGMRVDYLCGDAAWAMPAEHEKGLAYLRAVLSYNALAPKESRFDGFQYDVEPYILKGWPAKEIVDGYLGFLDKARDLAHRKLILGAAIPRWFDVPSLDDLHKKVIDRLDYVALMDYVDHAKAFVDDGRNEVEYATAKGKKAWLGAETQSLDDEPEATFYAAGDAVMESAFSAANAEFSEKKGYGGVAVHFYDSYRKLRP